jgi:hypothetical protein
MRPSLAEFRTADVRPRPIASCVGRSNKFSSRLLQRWVGVVVHRETFPVRPRRSPVRQSEEERGERSEGFRRLTGLSGPVGASGRADTA